VLSRLCDEVVAVSEFTRRALIDNDGFPPDKVRVLYNGVHLSDSGVGPDRASVRAALGLQPTDRVIGLCARLSPEKNVPLLLEAFLAIRANVPGARLVIAGDGPARPDLEASVRRLGLEADVALLGFRDDVPALMRAFDVFCLPSLTEGTSVTLLEAMNAACPAVVTSVGGNPEIVVDGVTGDCVPSGDVTALGGALTSMLHDRDRARRMGSAGRTRVKERFAFEGMVHGYEALYRRLGAPRRHAHVGPS
jgi:glycosyltransferase involved in cell wall biosynthesis